MITLSNMDALSSADAKFLWHPFTQASEWEKDLRTQNLVIARGRGVHLYDSRGKKYIDGVSSLWANLHGHRRSELDRAISLQLKKIAHSTFLGLTHEPAIRLAQALVRLAPAGLARVFYSDNGATAVEVALKMAFQYHAQSGAPQKTEFIALENSYHGDTIGSVSVGGIGLFHKKFRPLLFKTHFVPGPKCFHSSVNASRYFRYEKRKSLETVCGRECLFEIEDLLRRRKNKIAAVIVEPVVQGAAGILVMPPGYLKSLAEICRAHGALLIADEVAVGFGRTGKFFACEHEGVRPDLLCLAKGISGGYLPLAATLATEKTYRAFLGKYESFKTFFHGHTYTANPLACAAGLASLEIFRKEKTLERTCKLADSLEEKLKRMLSIPQVRQIRQAGLMAGIDLAPARGRIYPPGWRVGKKVCAEARNFGVLSRPLGDTLVLLPPLAIRERELEKLVSGIRRAAVKVLSALPSEK